MATVLARTPAGVTVLQDDGTIATLPPEAAPTDAAPDQGPVPDNAVARLATPEPATIDPSGMVPHPGDSPVPENATTAPPAMAGEAPPDAITGGGPMGLVDPFPGVQVPDAVSGGGPAAAPPPAPGTTTPPPAGAPPLPDGSVPADPWEAQAQAEEASGQLAAEAQNRQAQIDADTEDRIAKAQQAREKAAADLLQQQADAAAAVKMAAEAQAKYAARDPKQSLPDKIVTGIAVLLGAVGTALSRGELKTNPVLEVMARQAEDEAKRRTEQWLKYRDATASAQSAFDRIGKVVASSDAYYAGQIAGIKEQQALEIERQARLIGTQQALANGQIAAAKVRQEAEKHYIEAADKEMEARRKAAKDAIDAHFAQRAADEAAKRTKIESRNASTAAKNATTSRMTAVETARHNSVQEGIDAQRLAGSTIGGMDAATYRVAKDVEVRQRETAGPMIQYARTVRNPDGTTSVVMDAKPLMNAPSPVIDPVGRAVVDASGRPVVEPQEWHAPTPEVADQIRKKYSVTTQYVDLLDQMAAIIKENGWEPELLNNPKWKLAQQVWAETVLQKKGPQMGALGVLAGDDMPVIGKAIGVTDPTKWDPHGDPTAAIRQARQIAIDQFNTTLSHEGRYTGAPVEFPNITTMPGGIAGPEQDAARAAAGAIPSNNIEDLRNMQGTSIPAYNQGVYNLVGLATQSDSRGRATAIDALRELIGKDPDAVGPIAIFAVGLGVDPASISPKVKAAADGIDASKIDDLVAWQLGATEGLSTPATIGGGMTYETSYKPRAERRDRPAGSWSVPTKRGP